jgi:hypothetical protein
VRLRIRLIKKLARFLNGVDLDKLRVGEPIELPSQIARMLLAEGWAVLVDSDEGSQSGN